jgi:hypothetical protein
MDKRIVRGEKLYYARIMPTIGVYDVIDMKVRTVGEDWFVCTEEKTKHAFYFNEKDFKKSIFLDRDEALVLVKKSEKHGKKVSSEIYYEEY